MKNPFHGKRSITERDVGGPSTKADEHNAINTVPEKEVKDSEREEVSLMEELGTILKKRKPNLTKSEKDMLVMGLLAEDYPDSAVTFHKETGCPLPIQTAVRGLQTTVRELLLKHKFRDTINLINEKLGPDFFGIGPVELFRIEMQEIIELCRSEDFDAALACSEKFVRWIVCKDLGGIYTRKCVHTLSLMSGGDVNMSQASYLLDLNLLPHLVTDIVDDILRFQCMKTGGSESAT